LYLRRWRTRGEYHYLLRESYRHEGLWKHRDLMDLGTDPGEFIEYPGGNGFYFRPDLEDRLQDLGVAYSSADLEQLWLPFMKPHVRRVVEMFGVNGRTCTSAYAGSDSDQLKRQNALHVFDKRRLHYLRCGRIDIGRFDRRVWKCFHVLYQKSRDEIESLFESMELQLKPHELRPYLFTAFHVESCFPHNPLRHQPAALDGERVDDYFLEELCRLNRDSSYFSGIPDRDSSELHPYLTRYLILYFDHDFDRRSLWNQYVEDFVQARRRHRSPKTQPAISNQEALDAFGLDDATFQQMSRRDLIRLFRSRAKQIHPDTGGNHDAFIRLNEAFACLLPRKR
jgi:hypothetical protein